MPASWVGPLIRIAMHESGGNPSIQNTTAIDPTTGAITTSGQHATGLMQTLPATFQQYAMPGHTDINNPLDNMLAAIRYIQSRYGSADTALQKSLAGGY